MKICTLLPGKKVNKVFVSDWQGMHYCYCMAVRWKHNIVTPLLTMFYSNYFHLHSYNKINQSDILFLRIPLMFLLPIRQCSTTDVIKAVVCIILCGMMHIKEPLLLIRKSSLCGSSRFLSHYLSGPLPYI